MIQIQSQFTSENKPKIIILLDNVLDDTTGLELYNNLKFTQIKFNLDVDWILLSSTEDKNTISNQRKANINVHIEKPLTVKKVNKLLFDLN